MAISQLRQLVEVIANSAALIDSVCSSEHLSFPNLDEPIHLVSSADNFRSSAKAAEAADALVAAAYQIIALVSPPPISALQAISAHVRSAALRVCLESGVVEILREAGPEGMHIYDIGARTGLHAGKLGRLLRYLATHSIFRELKPDIFDNNMISSVLDSGKPASEILRNPEAKHDESNGFAALAELFGGDLHKSSAYLLENMRDPLTAMSDAPNHAPFNRALNVQVPLFAWYDQPEQKYRLRRFMLGMEGTEALQADDGILKTMEWESLPAGSTIVDIGGGLGQSCLSIASQQPHLLFVVQDKEEVVNKGRLIWERNASPSNVRFQAHDFFSPQPIKGADVYILKHIIHGFSDAQSGSILTHLRAAAAPHTHLIVIDGIIPYACPVEPQLTNIHGLQFDHRVVAPPPLLSNFGPISEMAYLSDLTMMLNLNAQERTLPQVVSLLKRTGWQVIRCAPSPSNFLQPLIALPIPEAL